MKRGKRTTLKWDLNPLPSTIQDKAAIRRPDYFPEIKELRKPLKIRNILPDQIKDFLTPMKISIISSTVHKVMKPKRMIHPSFFYRTDFDEKTDNVIES